MNPILGPDVCEGDAESAVPFLRASTFRVGLDRGLPAGSSRPERRASSSPSEIDGALFRLTLDLEVLIAVKVERSEILSTSRIGLRSSESDISSVS